MIRWCVFFFLLCFVPKQIFTYRNWCAKCYWHVNVSINSKPLKKIHHSIENNGKMCAFFFYYTHETTNHVKIICIKIEIKLLKVNQFVHWMEPNQNWLDTWLHVIIQSVKNEISRTSRGKYLHLHLHFSEWRCLPRKTRKYAISTHTHTFDV